MAKRPKYPWGHLGIEPTKDERAIKMAYAEKLKTHRPDEDPEGFAALVAARDRAVNLAIAHERPRKPKKQARTGATKTSASARRDRATAEDKPQGPPRLAESPWIGKAEEKRERIVQNLRSFFEAKAGSTRVVPDMNDFFLDDLRSLSLVDRELVEPEAARIIAGYLDQTSEERWIALEETQDVKALREDAILEIDEEFGWTGNDRRLEQIAGWEYDGFADQLQKLRNPRQIAATADKVGLTGWQRMVGFVVLAIFALQAFAAIARFLKSASGGP